ncbi:hypothetical protein EMU01_18170 [Enterococcus mundtii]|uniref:Uncharacterized protein n=1 Tax=Enterococcus mundtii TaxID=53346 RepID=A0ABQ0VDS2_ENTMU|nr:hypothetical protein EMU01_18170 [Enterococcus mundtii]GEN18645.1 hypothetical protein LAC02_19260 [Ligilactobacillus acidipiscis]
MYISVSSEAAEKIFFEYMYCLNNSIRLLINIKDTSEINIRPRIPKLSMSK